MNRKKFLIILKNIKKNKKIKIIKYKKVLQGKF
jgi:hypothetical protein